MRTRNMTPVHNITLYMIVGQGLDTTCTVHIRISSVNSPLKIFFKIYLFQIRLAQRSAL